MNVVDPSLASTRARIEKTLETTKRKVSIAAGRSTHLAISALSTILTLVLVFTVAVFLYATFYYAYMPVDLYKMPINFTFEPCSSTASKCSNPIGEIRLGKDEKLRQGQTYSMNLRLELPDNDVNQNHGMFMTCVSVFAREDHVIKKACKSSIAEFRSSFLRILETIAYSPFLLLGLSTQKQVIHINFFNEFQTDPRLMGERIEVEIQSKHIQVIKADLEIHAELKGLRYLMYKHSWISATFGIGSNILILFVIIVSSWTRFLTAHTEKVEKEEDVNCNHESQENAESVFANVEEEETIENVSQENIETPIVNNIQVQGGQRNLLSFLFYSMKMSIQLVFMFGLLFVSYQAYVHDVYEPSKLMEIVSKETKDLDIFKTVVDFVSSLYFAVVAWDDIFVKLLVIKIIFAVMLILIMSTTRLID